MKRLALVFVPASILTVLFFSITARSQTPQEFVQNFTRCEPVLTFDCTGSTLLGFYHQQLSVFNNGRVTISEMPIGAGALQVDVLDVEPAVVTRLVRDLYDAGAYEMEDQTIIALDVPMTTITVFRGDTNARAHTFNYYAPYEPYISVNQVIQDFIDANVPGF